MLKLSQTPPPTLLHAPKNPWALFSFKSMERSADAKTTPLTANFPDARLGLTGDFFTTGPLPLHCL